MRLDLWKVFGRLGACFVFLLAILLLSFSSASAYDGEELGYIDAVTVNNEHFEDLDENRIVFYEEDLINGEVVIRGILESEKKDLPVNLLSVEVTLDGGDTWQKVEGHANWIYKFRPDLDEEYNFSVRVVPSTPEPDEILDTAIDVVTDIAKEELELYLGEFLLNTKAEVTEGVISGVGSLDIGFLKNYLPENVLDEATSGLNVRFEQLKLSDDLKTVVEGLIHVDLNASVSLFDAATLNISAFEFFPAGAKVFGKLTFNDDLYLPNIPFYNLNLTKEKIHGLLEYIPHNRKRISLISGDYGVDINLKKISLDFDTALAKCEINDIDAALDFGSAYGNVAEQALEFVDGIYKWGSACAENAQSQATQFKVPNTSILIENIGGEIRNSFSGISLIGKIKIPVFDDYVELDLAELSALEISASGISSAQEIVFDKIEQEFDLSGFKAGLTRIGLDIKNNVISGALSAKLELAKFGDIEIPVAANVKGYGVDDFRIDAKNLNKKVSIPSFADIDLASVRLNVSTSGLSVSLDGSLSLTNPALKSFSADMNAGAFMKQADYYQRLGRTSIATAGRKASNLRGSLKSKAGKSISKGKGVFAAKGKEVAASGRDFVFRQLKVYKDKIELPALYSGWHDLSTPMSAKIDDFTLSASAWGLGSDSDGLWVGIKGGAEMSGSAMSGNAQATVQFFMNGTYRVLDFSANSQIKIGEFTLYTDAQMSGGRISGNGVLVSDFEIPSLPDSIKDAEGRLNLEVFFSNLNIDQDSLEVLAGEIKVPVEFSLSFEKVDISISELTFSPEAALAQGKVFLKGFDGISGISVENISFSSQGFGATVEYAPRRPLRYFISEHPYEVGVYFRSLKFSFNTADKSFSFDDLDAGVRFDGDFDFKVFDLGLKDDIFAWGSALAGDAQSAASSFSIPHTDFKIINPGGTLNLDGVPSLSLNGLIRFPGENPIEINIPAEAPLNISSEGLSTAAKIVVDNLEKSFDLAGFPAIAKSIGFEMNANDISAAIGGAIVLERFGGLNIDIDAEFGTEGLDELRVAGENVNFSGSIDGFADYAVSRAEIGYGESGMYVDLDADITLTHPMLKGFMNDAGSLQEAAGNVQDSASGMMGNAVQNGKDKLDGLRDDGNQLASNMANEARPLLLRGFKVYKDAIDFGESLEGWHALTPPAAAKIDTVTLLLNEWGVGAEGSKFWIGLKGGANVGGSSNGKGFGANATMTAQFFSDGGFRMADFDFSGEFAIGPFRLLTDASLKNGKLSGNGMIVSDEPMDFLPAALKDEATGCLSAAVEFADLVVDSASSVIQSGEILVDSYHEFNVGDLIDVAVDQFGFTADGLIVNGKFDLPEFAGMFALPDVSFEGIELGMNGFTGISRIVSQWERPVSVDIFENLGVALVLSSIDLSINWDASGLDMIEFNGIDGRLDLGNLFDVVSARREQLLEFVDDALNVTIPELKIPGTEIGIKDLKAAIDISGDVPKFNVKDIVAAIPISEDVIEVAGDAVEITSRGLSGDFSLSNVDIPLESFGFGAKVKEIAVEFDANEIVEGFVGLNVNLEKFYDITLDVNGRVSASGITDLHAAVDSDEIPTVDVFGVADVGVQRLAVGYASSEVYFEVDPVIDIKYDELASMEEFVMTGVKVYKDRLDAGRARLSESLDDVGFELGPAEVGISNIGVEISDDNLALKIDGDINLADLCDSTLGLAIDKNGLSLDAIEINYQKPGINMNGLLSWDDNGFGADVLLALADMFNLDGQLIFGRESDFTYWLAEVNMPVTIPLSPLPINMYKIGGGLAYHMKVEAGDNLGDGPTFTPDKSSSFVFIANTQLGTTDNGYTWHGDFQLIVDPSNYYILFDGNSYVMCSKEERPDDRRLSARIEMGASPKIFQLQAEVNFAQKVKSVEVFSVAGRMDILFSESDWHIYVGSKSRKIEVSALAGIMSGKGYLMIDSDGLMLGVEKSFNAEGSVACFYGRLYGGASLDLASGIRPFFIDATGKVWIGLEAGVKACGSRFTIIEAYASLALRIRAPDPTFMKVKAKMKYSFLGGWVSGTYKMTFWFPEKPSSDELNNTMNFPLISYMSPEDNAAGVSRITPFELNTTLPVDEPVRLDNGHRYMLRLVDVVEPEQQSFLNGALRLSKYINTADSHNAKHAIHISKVSGGQVTQVVGGFDDVDTVIIRAFEQLDRHASYRIYAQAHLLRLKDGIDIPDFGNIQMTNMFKYVERIENEEAAVQNTFTTADEDDLYAVREIVESVYPNFMCDIVYPNTEIRVTYRVPADGERISLRNKHYVKDPVGNIVVQPDEWRQGLGTVDEVMATEQWVKFAKPSQLLKPVLVYQKNETGEVLPAVYENGVEKNPFIVAEEEAASENIGQSHSPTMNGALNVNADIQSTHRGAAVRRTSGFKAERSRVASEAGAQKDMFNEYSGLRHREAARMRVSDPEAPFEAASSAEAYTRFYKTDYKILIKDEADEKIVYQNRFDVTDTEIVSNEAVVNATVDADPENVDPFDVMMLINGTYHEDEKLMENAEAEIQVFKDELFRRFMRGEFAEYPNGTPPELPPESAHYFDEDAEDHCTETWHPYSMGAGYMSYEYDYGYQPIGMNVLPPFERVLECPEALRVFEDYLSSREDLDDFHQFGAAEDIVMYFSTSAPINWDAINMTFEFTARPTGTRDGFSIAIDRRDYAIMSSPSATDHAIKLPMKSILSDSEYNLYCDMMNNYHGNDIAGAAMRVTMSKVETTVAEQNGETVLETKRTQDLYQWQFHYSGDIVGTREESQYGGCGSSYTYTVNIYSDLHFNLVSTNEIFYEQMLDTFVPEY